MEGRITREKAPICKHPFAGVEPPYRMCNHPGCHRKHDSRGFCKVHADQFRRHGNTWDIGTHDYPRIFSPEGKQKLRESLHKKNFKTGRSKVGDGYGVILVYGDDPLRGKYKYIHRHVMEQHIGRELIRTEIVHHIDGDRDNNDIKNLEIVSIAEHNRIHHYGKKPRPYKKRTKKTTRHIQSVLRGNGERGEGETND